jgi:drug/metabolite transporter (DMT)-like permease
MLWACLAIVYVVWGSTYLGIRIAVETVPPLLGAAVRFGAAAVLLGAVLAVRGGGVRALRVTRGQLAGAALVGLLLLAGGNGLVVVAESAGVPSGIAALLIATVPLIVVVLRLVTRDRPGVATLAGVAVGFAGLAGLVLSRGGGGGVLRPGWALLVLVGATSWSVGSFFSRRLPLPGNTLVTSVYEMAAGALAFAVAAVASGEPAKLADSPGSLRSWLALAYLTVFGSLVAYTAYAWLLANAPISLVSTYAYVNPVVAVALGAVVVHESVTPAVLLSGGVIVLGVALVVSTERPRLSTGDTALSTGDGDDRPG